MPIPKFDEIMLPILKLAEDEKEHTFREAVEALAVHFSLNTDERKHLLPSGTQFTFDNRVGWARTSLKKAKLIDNPRRGIFKITPRGIDLLKSNPTTLTDKDLLQYDEYHEYYFGKSNGDNKTKTIVPVKTYEDLDPEEALEKSYQIIRTNLAQELLDYIKKSSPQFFEKLVIDLLIAMGYGGSRSDAGSVVGKVGDGGIDGIIKEDRLGLDVIYVQAKKWQNPVGSSEIRDFVGSLEPTGVKKGIFITTSEFAKPAREYVKKISSKIIVLIDGNQLAEYMIDYNVGVSETSKYIVKKVDLDYFEAE